MPKSKSTASKSEKIEKKPAAELEKIIEIEEADPAVAVVEEDELIPGELGGDDPEDDEAVLDDEEVDPFKDKWEE